LIELRTHTPTNRYLFRLRLLVFLVVFSFGVTDAVAIPLSEYHELVAHVAGDFQSVLQKKEDETDADYESRLTETLDAVREEFPKSQPIESGNTKWTADNNWLHSAMDDLQRAPIEKRYEKIESIVELLRALDQRVNDLETAQAANDTKTTDKEKLAGILTRPEYAKDAKGENALTKFVKDLIKWFENLFPKPSQNVEPGGATVVSSILQVVVVILGLALVAYVVWLLLKRFKGSGRKLLTKKKEPRIVLGEKLKPEDTATDLLADAEALARRGELRAAIRKAYIALLVELGDRKLISLAQYKTNRDYVRAVSNLPQLHPRLKKLTESFERHWYGFAQATPNDWQDFRTGYRDALHHGN